MPESMITNPRPTHAEISARTGKTIRMVSRFKTPQDIVGMTTNKKKIEIF